MITTQDLIDWLKTLPGENVNVAVEDGGLTLVGLDREGVTTGASLEVGGVPDLLPDETDAEDRCSYCGSGLFSDRGVCLKCGL